MMPPGPDSVGFRCSHRTVMLWLAKGLQSSEKDPLLCLNPNSFSPSPLPTAASRTGAGVTDPL